MRILLADDHPLFREGVKPVLEKLDGDLVLVEANDYPTAFTVMHRNHGDFDLALLDLYMPGMDGIDGVSRFRAAFPDVPVIVLSAAEDVHDIQKLLALGASGYITKASSSEVILSAIRLVLSGGLYVPPNLLNKTDNTLTLPAAYRHLPLTTRQIQALRELAKGLTNRQIATELGVTEGTVKIHLAQVFKTLKVNNRTEALLVAQKMGLHKTGTAKR